MDGGTCSARRTISVLKADSFWHLLIRARKVGEWQIESVSIRLQPYVGIRQR